MVIGAVSATWVSVTTSLKLLNKAGEPYLVLQDNQEAVLLFVLSADLQDSYCIFPHPGIR